MKTKFLEHYLQRAMAKAGTSQSRRKVSTILAEALPEICTELRRMVTAPDSDRSTRKFAITMLESFWRSLLSTSQSENRLAVKRTQTNIKRQRVKVAEKQTALKIHELRSAADKKLEAI